jgi:outer membrane biosynthesis protein TonB
MSFYQYPGLFGDPRRGRLWPAIVTSIVLHAAFLGSFSRFHIQPAERVLTTPLYTVDLRGSGLERPAPARKSEAREKAPLPPARASEPAPPTEPATKLAPPKKAAPPEPPAAKPLPERAPSPRKAAEPERAQPPAPPKPDPGAKTLPSEVAPSPQAAASPAPVKRELPEPPPGSPPPQGSAQAPKSASAPGPADDQVTERIARLRQNLEQERVSARIDRMRREKSHEDEKQVSQKIAAFQERFSSTEGRGSGEGISPGASVGVRSGGNILQEVRLRVYCDSLWENVKDNWTLPPSLEGRGYEAVVAVVLSRDGSLVRPTFEKRSGNQVFDQMALKALELASAKGLLAIPREISSDSLEVAFRFRGR